MVELFNNFHFIFWGSIMLICVVPSIAFHWAKVRQAELDASLKRDMLDRGMSAEEICSILEASSKGASRKSCSRSARHAAE